MRITKCINAPVRLILLVALLVALLGVVVACEDLGFSPSDSQEETTEPSSSSESGPVSVNTRDAATLAVYLHLLGLAGSPEAKTYLSDFYTECNNWYAESEYFKDGSDVWNVVVDMTDEPVWDLRSYWQQASWFILNNGEVVPSNLFQANALRIEADLQGLSVNTSS